MATLTPRPPLGLPPGSIRGLLSLMIMGMMWILLMIPDSMKITIPLNMYCLLPLVMLFFFSHGKSIAEASDPTIPSPLYLPGGTLRVLIVGGSIAVIAYLTVNFPDRLQDRLKPTAEQIQLWPTLLGSLTGGLMVGYLLKYMPFRNHWTFQAIQAWLSILSVFTLLAELVIQAFIAPKITEEINLVVWQWIVTFLASLYFGSRT